MLTSGRKEELVKLCSNLVRIPSLSGQERLLAAFVRDAMQSMGFDEVQVDFYGSVIGTMDFGKGPCLLFEAQLDHVDVGNPFQWNHYPFGGFLEDGKIYGRGATDQKGALAAMMCAASFLKEDRLKDLCGRLVVSATVCQEKFEGVSSMLVAEKCVPDFVVTGEASGLALERGQRGRAEIVVEVSGKQAHSARPDYGVNAAVLMARLVSFIKDNFKPAKDPFLGEGIMELTSLVSYPENATGIVPDVCRAIFDRRLLPGETRSSVLLQVERLLEEAAKHIPSLNARAWISSSEYQCYTGAAISGEHFAPAWLLSEDHPFVKSCLKGLSRAGLPPRLAEGAGFGTNGCYYGGVASIPTIVFGPSRESLAHVSDEYIEIEEMYLGCMGYYGIAEQILSTENGL
ncbi:YgeY family selenium metabolism-linked hydrolase [Thermovirga lienii]|uniref:YgeY family selenium metabolism-linked hydrolase n=1 Tax=Thermovirga lienii TaxID=336261 RepID=UPI002FE3F65F